MAVVTLAGFVSFGDQPQYGVHSAHCGPLVHPRTAASVAVNPARR
jgi:hypothetical protein